MRCSPHTVLRTAVAIMSIGTEGVGLLASLVSCIFFGSNFVVTKKYKTGDGMFFQLCLCCGIWLTGFFVRAASPVFWLATH